MEYMETNNSLRAQVIDLQVGQSITLPLDRYGYTTIRSYASDLGFAFNRKYTTSRNKAERSYTITRVS